MKKFYSIKIAVSQIQIYTYGGAARWKMSTAANELILGEEEESGGRRGGWRGEEKNK